MGEHDWNRIGRIIDALARRLRDRMPGDCILCRAPATASGLCPDCRDDLPAVPAARCPVCASPTGTGATCGPCLRNPPAFDAVVAAAPYAFPVDALVHALKYGHRLAASIPLASVLADAVQHESLPDLIVPVPLSRERLMARGFNQALEIARALPAPLGARIAATVLERRRDTAPQATLSQAERAQNVRDAFDCTGNVRNATVVLLDDVMTTGATLHAAASALRRAGAAAVRGWVVARALV
jgi:ComF family protein